MPAAVLVPAPRVRLVLLGRVHVDVRVVDVDVRGEGAGEDGQQALVDAEIHQLWVEVGGTERVHEALLRVEVSRRDFVDDRAVVGDLLRGENPGMLT